MDILSEGNFLNLLTHKWLTRKFPFVSDGYNAYDISAPFILEKCYFSLCKNYCVVWKKNPVRCIIKIILEASQSQGLLFRCYHLDLVWLQPRNLLMCSGGSSGLHFDLVAGMCVWGTDDLKEGGLYSNLDLSFLFDKD